MTTVGNFHLLPISHVPQVQQPLLRTAVSNCEGTGVRDVDHGQELGIRPALQPPVANDSCGGTIDPSCAWTCGGDSGRALSLPSSGGCFVSGAAVGVLVNFLLAWLVVTRGYGKKSLERCWNWLNVERGSRKAVIGDEGARKAGVGVRTRTVGDTNPCLQYSYINHTPISKCNHSNLS